MTRIAALLARLLPYRARHSGSAAPAAPAPDGPAPAVEDQGVSPSDMTIFDLPPARVRRYVRPDDEDGGQ